MITPETKDWTWVLERPCAECGFDAGATRAADVASLVRANAADWQALLDSGAIRAGRPDDATWSTLEYACHVRDVFRIMDGRIRLMLGEDDPTFPNWDQDASAVSERYEEQYPATAVGELVQDAEQIAELLDAVDAGQWPRPGRRSDGAVFTVDRISRYMVHDVIHHVWDVRPAS